MNASDLLAGLTRLIVIVAACLGVAPIVRRSARRRLTLEVMVVGIVLALVPTALQFLQSANVLHLSHRWALLTRTDMLGFAMILFGVVLGLRDASRSSDKLRRENLLLQREAATDFLTGLLNRREAEALLEYGAARVRQSRDPLGFIMVDLDRFKQVNDTLGHAAGDAVLAHVGKLLKSRARSGDIVARYGGEEFLLVVSEPNHEVLVTLAEDLRKLIEQTPTQYEEAPITITASFGVAVCTGDTKADARESTRQADAALYAAKALGRNQVVCWEQALQQTDSSVRSMVLKAHAA